MAKHDQFFKMLDTCPRISGLWDRRRLELDLERFEIELKVLSSGEAHLARFFAGVWLGHNDYGFDLIAAMHTLDKPNDRLISDWIRNSIFP